MNLAPLSTFFEVTYGVNLELNRLALDRNGIPFVGRSGRNNGITARVAPVIGVAPNPANTLSVAGGGSVLATFLQKEPYYSGRDLFYLTPRVNMSDSKKLFYCACIRANRYRYNYGRQANKTLRDLMIPDLASLPEWLDDTKARALERFRSRLALLKQSASKVSPYESADTRSLVPVGEVFEVSYGHSLELNRLEQVPLQEGGIPFVSRKMGDNGVAAYVRPVGGLEPAPAGELTCALSGNGVLSTFIQDLPFYTAFHIARLKSQYSFSHDQLLYYCRCIWANRYRYSYGRQANRTLGQLLVPAPSGIPDWVNGGIPRVVDRLLKPLSSL